MRGHPRDLQGTSETYGNPRGVERGGGVEGCRGQCYRRVAEAHIEGLVDIQQVTFDVPAVLAFCNFTALADLEGPILRKHSNLA